LEGSSDVFLKGSNMTSQSDNYPFITVCMPVRNEADFIAETLIQLLTQDYPANRFEIIVADGESSDNTRRIVEIISRKFPQVLLRNNPKRLSGAGRNVCFAEGRGDIFLVVDGHCYVPSANLFKNVVECFEKSDADCLGRAQPLDPPKLTPFQKAVAAARRSRIGHSSDSLIYSGCEGFVSPRSNGAVYKRSLIEKVGRVDEAFDACEDVEFNCRVERAGLKTYMSPCLTIKYYPRSNLPALFKQMVRYGRGRYRLIAKHPGMFSFNIMVPPLFVIGLFLLPFLLIRGRLPALAGLGTLGIYLLMLFGTSISIALREGAFVLPLLGPIFFTIHAGIGYGFLKEALGCLLNGWKKCVCRQGRASA
ncbi:MAG: glycosyltransferase family 2 protein, partial [Desulfatitalea sp.]